jgi:filamentous hemagglutinin family protein
MPGTSRLRAALLCGTAIVLPAVAAAQAPQARPQGGQVVAGGAGIAQDAARTRVTQSTDRAAIDWRSFDIGRDHTVQFQQPSSGSVTLNRVTGPDPSQIAGRITANGQVAIVNQSGVVFHQGAQVDAAGLVVSTANITNEALMRGGRLEFSHTGRPDARIENRGSITVRDAGLAALVAPQVANRGTIAARMGRVALAGAEAATVDLHGDGLMSIEITRPVSQRPANGEALVSNTGTISATGGTVLLTAQAVDGIVQDLVQAGGTVSAETDAATGRTGRVVVAGTGGAVRIEGAVTATGTAANTRGGSVEILGDRNWVAPGARVDASGAAGGGRVTVGTDGRGAATTRLARRTGVAAGATVRADATQRGDGGTVLVNSADYTAHGGEISAQGGPQGGDGGFVEVSGQKGLDISGRVDVNAGLGGRIGTILLDPTNLFIISDGSSGANVPPGTYSDGVLSGAEPPTGDAFLNAGSVGGFAGNLRLEATESITVQAPITKPTGDLTFFVADGPFTMSTSGSVSLDSGNLNLTANSFTLNGNIRVPAGTVTLTAASSPDTYVTQGTGASLVAHTLTLTNPESFGAVSLNSASNRIENIGTFGGRSVDIRSIGSVKVIGPVSTTNGSVRIDVDGNLTVSGSISAFAPLSSSSILLTAGGNITLEPTSALRAEYTLYMNPTRQRGFVDILAGYERVAGRTNTGSAAKLTLDGSITADRASLSAGTGGIEQGATGSLQLDRLDLTSGGDALLNGTPTANNIGRLLPFSIAGAFVLDNGTNDIRLYGYGSLDGGSEPEFTSRVFALRTGGRITLDGDTEIVAREQATFRTGGLLLGSYEGSDRPPSISAPLVEIAPNAASQIRLIAGSAPTPLMETTSDGTFQVNVAGLAGFLAPPALTGTLRLGATTFNDVTTTTASGIQFPVGLSFGGTLDLRATGNVAQAAGTALAATRLTGLVGGSLELAEASNSLPDLGDIWAGRTLRLNTSGPLTLNGTLQSPSTILSADASVASLGAGRIAGDRLAVTSRNGTVTLAGDNAVSTLAGASAGGALQLNNTGALLTVPTGTTVTGGGGVEIRQTGALLVAGSVTSGGGTLLAAGGDLTLSGSVSSQLDTSLLAGGSATLTAGSTVEAGQVDSRSIRVLAGYNAAADATNLTSETALRLDGNLSGPRDAPAPLANLVLGAGTGGVLQSGGQIAGAALAVTSGGDASFAAATTPNRIGTLLGSRAAGRFHLDNGSDPILVGGDVSATEIGLGTTGAITIAGRLTGTQTIALRAGGDITQTGAGRIAGGVLGVQTPGAAILSGANSITALSDSATGGAIALNNTGALLTVPAGNLVQAGAGLEIAQAGDLTVDGTLSGVTTRLSSPAGTIRVNGNSAIARGGNLEVASDRFLLAGLLQASGEIRINAGTLASLAGRAAAPSLQVTAPTITFSGLDATLAAVRLNLGTAGQATGGLDAAALSVAGGSGAGLTGSVAGISGEAAAAQARRAGVDGTPLSAPLPNADRFVLNGCAIGVAACGTPPSPPEPPAVVPPPAPVAELPAVPLPNPVAELRPTLADRPRAVLGDMEAAAAAASAQTRVRPPAPSISIGISRDRSEEEMLAPPGVRREDY